MLFTRKKPELPSLGDALPGRDETMPVHAIHLVLGTPLTPPFPEGFEQIVVGMGCFWGADALFRFGSPMMSVPCGARPVPTA